MNQFIVDHVWQSTVFALLAALLTLAFRSNRAQVRFSLWLAASAKFLLPFSLFTVLGRSLRWNSAPTFPAVSQWSDAVMEVVAPANFTVATAPLAGATSSEWPVATILWACWACGVAVLLIHWLRQWTQLRDALTTSSQIPLDVPIPVVSTSSLFEPGLVGIFRPVLMLPEGIGARLTPQQMAALIAHELCHWRRRDNLTAIAHMLVQALFWFNPVVWWIGVQLIAEREIACDEAVVALGNEPKSYAESIVEVCRFYVTASLACTSGVSGAGLKTRVRRIMENASLASLSRFKTTMLTGIAAATLFSPLILGVITSYDGVAQAQIPSSPSAVDESDKMRDEQQRPRTVIPLDPKQFDKYVGFYQLGPNTFFTITRQGDHFFARLTGQRNVEQFPESPTKFFATVVAAQISFAADAQGQTTELILHQNGREQHAPKVDESLVKAGEAILTEHIKNNAPDPDRVPPLRRFIDALIKGQPNLDDMSPSLIAATNQQWPLIQERYHVEGTLKSLEFQNVGQQGYDNYLATFEGNKTILFQIGPLTADHKMMGLLMQPGAPGPAAPLGMAHYKSGEWNFELDIPKGWNSFPPPPTDNHGMVIRFQSNENGNHSLGIFRTPYDPKRDPKATVDQIQEVLAKAGLTNFIRSETKIGSKTVITLDWESTVNGRTSSGRHYFVIDGTILHILGFATTNREAMFPTFDRMAKSFVFNG